MMMVAFIVGVVIGSMVLAVFTVTAQDDYQAGCGAWLFHTVSLILLSCVATAMLIWFTKVIQWAWYT